MNRITQSLVVKVTAVLLFVVTVILFIGGIAGIAILYHYSFYELPAEKVKAGIFRDITWDYANSVFHLYFIPNKNNPEELSSRRQELPTDSTNFFFSLKNSDGEILFSNYSGQEYRYSWVFDFIDARLLNEPYDESRMVYEEYTMECFVKNPLDAGDYYYNIEGWIDFAYKMRYSVIVVTVLSLAAGVVLFIFLMCSAGRRKGSDRVIPNGIDKIPFDLLLLIVFIIGVLEAVFFSDVYMNDIGYIISIFLFMIADILLLLLVCMSFATRYKLGGWWRNTVIWRIVNLIARILRKVANILKYFLQNLPVVMKAILILAALSVFELLVLFMAGNADYSVLLFFWFCEKIILVPAIVLVAINLQKLKEGGRKIAMGDLSYQIDTRYMFWDFKDHGENLNRISEGMTRAVEERLKSERFKTELITNVSHDIKTPLTSIINYVDLIKKENIENEKLKEYIDVLDRQSSRLKKLTEDLIEASKASTGNLQVNMAPTGIGVLFTQAVGEYEERIKNTGLELILDKPAEEVYIMADGRLLWRVFDNLLNNICKYAQPGTRVYLNLEKINGKAVITFRNISRYALNISSDELLERFVRGDRSRNTEGSGLGLSIAKSLTELQKGVLELYIDGDLFKVILKFDIINQPLVPVNDTDL